MPLRRPVASRPRLTLRERARKNNRPGSPIRNLEGQLSSLTRLSSAGRHLSWVPARHLAYLVGLLRLQAVCASQGYALFLWGGALLGSVRQGGFAGRPKDLDVGLIISPGDEERLTKTIMRTSKYSFRKSPEHTGDIRCLKGRSIWGTTIYVDMMYFQKVGTNYVCRTHKSHTTYSFKESPTVPSLESGSIYGFSFHLPNDPVDVIRRLFGVDWQVPSGRQYLSRHSAEDQKCFAERPNADVWKRNLSTVDYG